VYLHPEQIAVTDAEFTLTYRDLNALANRIAHAILAVRGAESEPVALLVGSGAPIVAAMLGVLKAGKFYVPLDVSQPLARTVAVLTECRPALLIVDNERLTQVEALLAARTAGLPSLDLPLLNVEDLEPGLCEANPCLDITGTDLAYVLYTSGSTGKPKGVMQDHRYVVHLTKVYTSTGCIAATDRLALLYSPSFAGAVRDIYCTLLNGATLCSFEVKRAGLARLADWLRAQQITVCFAVATLFRHFCRQLTANDRFPSIRLIELGSETVHAGDVHLYRRYFPQEARLIVNFGGSEISPICQFPVDAGTLISAGTVPAGYAAEAIELLVWDEEGKPVAPGAAGEIVVRSRYLSRGYWGRADLTDAAFLPDPEGGERRLFRTGDLGRMLPDGCLLHLGRRDFQVKIRGYRVETAELEAFLTGTAGIRDAAVTAWVDASGEQNLAVWWVPSHREAAPSIKELRSRIAAALPDYMMPASFVRLDALPLTPSGKLDRRALPDPRVVAQRPDAAHVAPQTPVERRLREIWSELLGSERIGIHENFFELGGNSLLALQATARIAAVFRVALPPNCLFECATLARLGQRVEGARSIDADEVLCPQPHGTQLPLSLAQQRMWLLAALDGLSDACNIVRAFRLEGVLNPMALQRALAALGRRHDNLRATFRMVGDSVLQVIAAEIPSVLSFVDLRHVPQNRCQAALDTSLRAAHAQCFDLARGPLWSVRVMRLAEHRHVLHLALHHVIGDDWSVQVLLRELATLYGASLAGTADPLPELPVQYTDYAHWQRRWLTAERSTTQIGYWQDHLRNAPPLTQLPLDRPRETGRRFQAGSVRLHFDRDLTTRLRRLSREAETTLFITLLAGYAVLLSRYGNPPDIVIATVVANRYPVETEALIGFFVNTLALRLKWCEGATFREIQTHAQRSAVNGLAHPDVPFDQIIEALQPVRSSLYSPVFQTLFVLQNIPQQELVLPGLVSTPLDLARPSAGANFDLTLSLQECDGELRGALEFDATLFDSITIERMATHFGTLLAAIVQSPDMAAAGLPL
jgi:amino acid adenylation domain-containing protein